MGPSLKRRGSRAWLVIALMVAFAAVAVLRPPGRRTAGAPTGAVEYVFDGDTVLLADGRRVRYIGIDCPELDSANDRNRRLASAARDLNVRLVGGKTVRLEYDVETKDRYGRTLAYVYVGDTFVNGALVRAGLARSKVYGDNTRYAGELDRLEEAARAEGRGLWADD